MADESMKTSDVYRTKNIPERFDNPSAENNQVCYMQGNPIFSVLQAPPSITLRESDNDEACFKGYSEKKVNPLFRTSNMDYGLKKPNVHTMPTVYYSRTTGFTEHLGKCGMYRDQGLNCTLDKSKV